jgi:dipeptidyl aminopeptidase/acylaminoacyl peptidase
MGQRSLRLLGLALSAVLAGAVSFVPVAEAVFPGTNGRIAFAQNSNNFCPDILSVEPDGTGLGSLTLCPEGAADPAWSPSASQVAFSTRTSEAGVGRIAVMGSDGSGLTLLTNNEDDDDPAWSPSGTQIAFARGRTGPDSANIWKMNADGTSPVNLTNQGAGSINDEPDWSPDGSKIVFQSKSGPQYDIFVMGSDGSGRTNLTINSNSANDLFPSWSPDGTKIVFTSARDGNNEIYVMSADGSNPQRLTTNTFSDIQPAYSPDGAQIVFTRGCPDEQCEGTGGPADGDVYRMLSDGTGEVLVAGGAGAQMDPDWGVSCPECPPPTGGTCPPDCPPVPDARSLTLKLTKHLKAKGILDDVDDFVGCVVGVTIIIQKKKNGSFKNIAEATTKDDGCYARFVPDKPGKYRAMVEEGDSGGTEPVTCEPATSKVQTHSH